MNSRSPESAAALADSLRSLAFDIEQHDALDSVLKARVTDLLHKLQHHGFDTPIADFTAAPGSFAPSIVVGFLRRFAERIEYSEDEKTRATARAEATIARWLHRFEEILDIPRGHLRDLAKVSVPAGAFADFVLRLDQRIRRESTKHVPPEEAWKLVQQSVTGFPGIDDIGPEAFIPRGLACSIIVRHLRLRDSVTPVAIPFRDLPFAHPAFHDVAILRHLGVVSGWYTDNLFRPQRAITYFEVAKIVAGVFRVKVLGQTTPTRVFFAHSGKDKDVVRRLKAQLETRGIQSWMDEEQVTPGDDVRRAIEENVSAPDVVVVAVISTDSLKSKWVQYELKLALAATPGKRPKLVPVKIDGVKMPKFLADTAYVQLNLPRSTDVEGAADFERACEEILTAIETADLQAALTHVAS